MPPSTVRLLFAWVGLLALAVSVQAAEPAVVETRDGRVFSGRQSFKLEAGQLAVQHAGGRSRVPVDAITRMPPEPPPKRCWKPCANAWRRECRIIRLLMNPQERLRIAPVILSSGCVARSVRGHSGIFPRVRLAGGQNPRRPL